ncbi:type II toxin-antitoxin system YafQ family toxin [Lactobacillus sp. ESL0681]|uniref:type II toxin-antitoxin system YafQ family toxin n=1 Tax=Lactobacillus sp. ESL0681 TaxID=2983211 RepID=UPI0023F6BF97|nr:type II toxin-antitoxin system YafQ family toxin [Lactobacillus sp. ESL0681]WEV39962.1 type II toxin-antitoxin system YafQ family toxin [Lactobacillus sp. ESL0681]
MFQIKATGKFKRDVKRCNKQGLEMDLLKKVVHELELGHELDRQYKNHGLSGNYDNFLECHIKPDWLLIYRVEQDTLILIRTGSHADLF